MDWLNTVPAPIVAGGMTALAAIFAAVLGSVNASITGKNQRALEREKALRDYRREQVRPLLQSAERRYMIMCSWEDQAVFGSSQAALPDDDPAWGARLYAIGDQRLRTAFDRFLSAYSKADRQYSNELPTGEEWNELQASLSALSKAAEDYIFGK